VIVVQKRAVMAGTGRQFGALRFIKGIFRQRCDKVLNSLAAELWLVI
jgi:hypothetical protein